MERIVTNTFSTTLKMPKPLLKRCFKDALRFLKKDAFLKSSTEIYHG